jgi:hypothetical protein
MAPPRRRCDRRWRYAGAATAVDALFLAQRLYHFFDRLSLLLAGPTRTNDGCQDSAGGGSGQGGQASRRAA